MLRPRPLYMPTPRIWNAEQLASRLGVRVSWFYQHRLEPEAEGFAMKDNTNGP